MIVGTLDELRHACASKFSNFFEYSCSRLGFNEIPDFHFILCDFMEGVSGEWRHKICEILGFRLAAKSFCVRQYCQWRWLRNPNLQIVIESSTDDLAKAMTKALKLDMASNPLLEHLAPKHGSEHSFNLQGISPELGYSLRCSGVATAVTSSRCDLYVFDDPEPNRNPESMRKAIKRSFEEAQHILHAPKRWERYWSDAGFPGVPHQERRQMIVVGQPHYSNTVYVPNEDEIDPETEERHPLHHIPVLKIPVIRSDGSWMWEYIMHEKYWNGKEDRPETLDEVKSRFSEESWQCEMMLNPRWSEHAGVVLRLDHIEEKRALIPNPFMSIDPADSENGCEWGVTIGGIFNGKIHVSHMIGFKGEAYDYLDKDETLGEAVWARLFDLATEFNVRIVLLEKNLKAARQSCHRFMRQHRIHGISIVETTARVNKLRRIINTLEPIVNNGILSCDPTVLADRKNRVQFAKLRHRELPKPCDRLDSLEALCDHILEVQPYAVANGFLMKDDRGLRTNARPLRFKEFQRAGLNVSSLASFKAAR